MNKIDRILKELSDLYEFNRRLKDYKLKKNKFADKRLERNAADHSNPQD